VRFVTGSVLPDSGAPAQPLPAPDGASGQESLADETVQRIRASLEEQAASRDLVLVEGPSLSTDSGQDRGWAIQLSERLDGGVLLVVRHRSGLSAEGVLRLCQPFGQRLVGVLINVVTRYKERQVRLDIAPAIKSAGIDFLGAVAEDRTMLAVTVEQVAEHLSARWVLGEDRRHDLVESFLIGGNIMDSGETYFGRRQNQAVVTRGDRPDLQLAALSGAATCLVLTGGHDPIQYVHYQAEQQGVPLMVVQEDTLSTARALDTVIDRATVHHARKLERFQELLGRSADVASIEVGL
jgi:BioD-like phosphotransacetylase family protein